LDGKTYLGRKLIGFAAEKLFLGWWPNNPSPNDFNKSKVTAACIQVAVCIKLTGIYPAEVQNSCPGEQDGKMGTEADLVGLEIG